MREISQCQVIGLPYVRTWAGYRQGCLATYGGGHRSDGHLEAFQHGMETVFNLLEAEFPPAELCKAAPSMLKALEWIKQRLERGGKGAVSDAISQCDAEIWKAKGEHENP